MNAKRLLALYDRVAEAPDAVSQLRRFVLDLAVRGKLVKQEPGDKPGSELLKQIEAEKARLNVKNRRNPLTSEEIPYALPVGWGGSRIGELCTKTGSGSTPRGGKTVYRDSGIPFLRSQNVFDWGLRLDDVAYIGPDVHARMAGTTVHPGDLLLNITGGSMGRCARVPCEFSVGNVSQHVAIVRPAIPEMAGFLHKLILSPYFQNFIFGEQTGAGRGGLPKNRMDQIPVALPPLAEQRRIVTRVDELMSLCDQLEANHKARESTRDRLTKASYVRLSAPETSNRSFRSHARFALDALPALTTRAEQIRILRQTILDLAVRGKLVDQDPEDESASELLRRIAEKKVRLRKVGKIRKPRNVAPLNSDELPYGLPVGWEWTQMAYLGVINPRNNARDDHKASFVPMPLIAAEYGAPHEHEPRPWGAIKKGYTHFAEGDVGLAKITPCFENGKSTVFRNLTGGFGSGTTELHVVRPLFVNADYIVAFLKSPRFIETGIPRMTGTAGQKRVPTEYFTSSPFPLPPHAEQQRIVEKVNSLMALCDRLESGLSAINATHTDLLESVLHEALRRTNRNQVLKWS